MINACIQSSKSIPNDNIFTYSWNHEDQEGHSIEATTEKMAHVHANTHTHKHTSHIHGAILILYLEKETKDGRQNVLITTISYWTAIGHSNLEMLLEACRFCFFQPSIPSV